MRDELRVLLSEYESLRRESLDTMTHRTQIASFGLAAVGALFAGVSLARDHEPSPGLVIVVIAFGVPLIAALVLVMWFGELERMERAGSYLQGLERRINELVGEEALGWESWLGTPRNQSGPGRLVYPYLAVIGLFSLIGLGAPVAAVFLAPLSGPSRLLVIPGWLVSLGAGVYTSRRVRNRRLSRQPEDVRQWLESRSRTPTLRGQSPP
jgi:hypothetical protein